MTRRNLGMMMLLTVVPSGIAIATLSSQRSVIAPVQSADLQALPMQIKTDTEANIWIDAASSQFLAATTQAEEENDTQDAAHEHHHPQWIGEDTIHLHPDHEQPAGGDDHYAGSSDFDGSAAAGGGFIRLAGRPIGGPGGSRGGSHASSSGAHVPSPDHSDAGDANRTVGDDTQTELPPDERQNQNPHYDEPLPSVVADLPNTENSKPQVSVPEPASLTLFGMALFGLGLSRRRRGRAYRKASAVS